MKISASGVSRQLRNAGYPVRYSGAGRRSGIHVVGRPRLGFVSVTVVWDDDLDYAAELAGNVAAHLRECGYLVELTPGGRVLTAAAGA